MAAIRAADPLRDAADCAAIYAPSVAGNWVSFELDPPDEAEMARRIARFGQSHCWLVAEWDGALAGYAYGATYRERAAYSKSCEVAIYVHPAMMRRGVGRALYAALLPRLAEMGFHAVLAAIALPNPASIALHEAMGFGATGVHREVGWKCGAWRDVGWWQRLL